MTVINQSPTENVDEQRLLEVENEYWVTLYNDLESLKQDERFKRIILEGYFKDRAINGVSMLSNPGVMARGERKDLFEEMVAISNLQHYFIMIEHLGSAPVESDEE